MEKDVHKVMQLQYLALPEHWLDPLHELEPQKWHFSFKTDTFKNIDWTNVYFCINMYNHWKSL